jgi:hypothetical protein
MASRMATCVTENEVNVTAKSASMDSSGQTIYRDRPNFDAMVVQSKQDSELLGVSHVALSACSPVTLAEQLKNVCRMHNSHGGMRLEVYGMKKNQTLFSMIDVIYGSVNEVKVRTRKRLALPYFCVS